MFRFVKVFAICVLVLAALEVIANQFTTMIPALEGVTWPGALVSSGIFLMAGVNMFDHGVVFDILALAFNGAIFTAIAVILWRFIRSAFGESRTTAGGNDR